MKKIFKFKNLQERLDYIFKLKNLFHKTRIREFNNLVNIVLDEMDFKELMQFYLDEKHSLEHYFFNNLRSRFSAQVKSHAQLFDKLLK